MRTRLLIITAALALCLNSFAQEKKTIKSKLNDATVFFQGAELLHTATATLVKGDNEIYIEGLSPNIDKNSLKIKTTNGVIVSAYEFSVDYLTEGKSSNTIAKKLTDSIDIYQKKLDQVKTEIKITANLIDLLQQGTEKNVSGSDKGMGIDELMKTMDYYKSKSLDLYNVQTANEKKRDECSGAISRLRKQLDQESLKNNKTSGIIKLALSAPVAANCNFTISYYTTAAGWTPYYDINIASTDKPIKIAAKSKVRQTTGLDWERVKLTLSSAVPSNGKVAPLFNAWFLDYYRPQARTESSSAYFDRRSLAQNSYSYKENEKFKNDTWFLSLAAGANMAVGDNKGYMDYRDSKVSQPLYVVDGAPVDADYMASLDQNMIKDVNVLKDASSTAIYGSRGANGVVLVSLKSMDDYVSQKENELTMVYNIDMPYTIPGNGKEQTIDLQTRETTAEYKYYCAPKLDPETYLLAEISNWEQLNLLSGKANITYDGTYVGESFINARSIQDKLTLTLGTDKRVTVKREKMQDFSSTKFLGSDTKQAFAYRLTVRNGQNKPVKMVLKDQYPISTQKAIEVELLKETTAWTANKEDLGVITWEEEIKAGETKTYQINYTVKYPKGSNLNL
ncbi:DUF4139 domain-containing protein [Dysgonomonas sp. OttesenSCG-928-D17]|nr:DUF4139 domain-containing protein [Dysgonomonas sp. OttesenSCG-928-D17]